MWTDFNNCILNVYNTGVYLYTLKTYYRYTVFNIHSKNRFITSYKQFVTNLISDIDLCQ